MKKKKNRPFALSQRDIDLLFSFGLIAGRALASEKKRRDTSHRNTQAEYIPFEEVK